MHSKKNLFVLNKSFLKSKMCSLSSSGTQGLSSASAKSESSSVDEMLNIASALEKTDPVASFAMYHKAASAGNVLAMFHVASALARGEGATQNLREAQLWDERAENALVHGSSKKGGGGDEVRSRLAIMEEACVVFTKESKHFATECNEYPLLMARLISWKQRLQGLFERLQTVQTLRSASLVSAGEYERLMFRSSSSAAHELDALAAEMKAFGLGKIARLIGLFFLNQRDSRRDAKYWFLEAVHAGDDPEAAFQLGELALQYDWDFPLASKCFTMAANKGHGASLVKLAVWSHLGEPDVGIKVDLVQALQWYLKAEQSGKLPAHAAYNLGLFYHRGLGGAIRNPCRALALFTAAADLYRQQDEEDDMQACLKLVKDCLAML